MRKSRKFLGATILGATILCLCVFSCQNDSWGETQRTMTSGKKQKSKNKELTLALAQQWYNENQSPIAQMRSSNQPGIATTLVKPSWESGKESNRGRYEVVETSLKTQGGHLLLDHETILNFDPLIPDKAIRNTARMVVMKDIKTGDTRSFIMIFVGSYNYLKSTKNMGRNSYLYRESDFDGSVLFYELDGKFINGWRYNEGKIIASISQSYSKQSNKSSTRAIIEDCTEFCYTYYDQVCDDYSYWEDDDEWGSTLVVEGYCYDVYTEECYQQCSYYDDGQDDDDDDWNYPDPPGSVDPPTNPSKVIDKIYSNDSDLSSNDKERLSEAMTVLQQNPSLNQLLQDLTKLNVRITFTCNSNISQAHFNRTTGEIVFKNSNNINSDNLREELIHAMQYYGIYGNDMVTSKTNFEFEAKIFQDLACCLAGGFCSSIAAIGMDDNEEFNNIYNNFILDYYVDPDTKFNSEYEEMYNSMGKLWDQYPGSFDENIEPELLRKYFK